MKKIVAILLLALFPVIACDEKEDVRVGPKEIKAVGRTKGTY
jgi:hypothetical protein